MSVRTRIAPVALLLAVSAPVTAHAWKHIDPAPYVWLPEDMPIPYVVQEACEDSVPPEYCLQMIGECWDAWEAVPCVALEGEYAGPYEGSPPGVFHTFDLGDRHNHWSFDDPSNDLEPGVLGATLVQRFGVAMQLFGENYQHADNGDICFNDNIDFGTQEEILGGQCSGQSNMRSVGLHELGHFLGLGHSCDDGEVCNDPKLLGAVMYWTSAPCETLVEPQEDDIQGITPLYGPSATFSCSHKVPDADLAIGVVPFELKCVIESRDYLQDVTSASWTFGDGGTGEGINAAHTYTEAGNYTIRVEVEGESEGCGEDGWASEFRKVGFVRACDVPDVSFGVEHVDLRQYRMINETDVSVYGCIQDILWSVYKGDKVTGQPIAEMTVKAWEPIFDFPEDGTYTVVANVGGIAGTGAASLTFDVNRHRGSGRGCDTTGAVGAGFAGLLVVGLGLVGIRRRAR